MPAGREIPLTGSNQGWLSVPGPSQRATLIANWFRDSLEGAVTRRRGIERSRYRFFLGQSIDGAEPAAGRERPLKGDASSGMSCQKWIE